MADSTLLVNHRRAPLDAGDRPGPEVRAFHRRLPGYAPTPLRDVPALASACGVGRVLVKDESSRMGLPSFKILGASWATYRLLCGRLAAADGSGPAGSDGPATLGKRPGSDGSGGPATLGKRPGPDGPAGSGLPAGSGERARSDVPAGSDLPSVPGEPAWSERPSVPGKPAGSERPSVPGEPAWSTLDELAAVVAARLGPLRLVTATDGNHGRAVAHVARLLGLSATVLVPERTAAARIAGIESEGAEVRVVGATYDDAVAASAALADDRTLVVSDTSWPGYEDPPRWVIEGYSTIFAEVADQVAALGLPPLDVAVVPVGVGALAAAAAVSLRPGVEPADGPLLVGVEPDTAACVAAAVEAGHVVEVPGPHRSIMAGLNCGLASPLALPPVTAAYGAFVGVGDDRCRDAVRAMADAGIDVGETGAAALAGLAAVVEDHRDALPLPEGSTVLLLATEGATDPVAFAEIVGRLPH